MINTPPPVSFETITSNSATYIPTTSTSVPAASVAGLRRGANIIYVVAVDDMQNYSPTNRVYKTFYLNSSIPNPPKNISIADSSIKDVSIWRAAIVWDEPDYKGTGDLTYHIDRSEDGVNWRRIAETRSFAFIDTVEESKRYYWRVGSSDNSDESIKSPSFSNAVTIIPRGKYTVPPNLTSGPSTSNITTTKARVTWTTSRTGDSKVAYGLSSGNYFDSELSTSAHVTEHNIDLTNLKPGTKYYYVSKWTDEDGNTGISPESTFETEPPPKVKDVRLTNLGISSVNINFTTTNASKARIYYGTTTAFGGVREIATSTQETTYTIQLDNLLDGTKYYYEIKTFDAEDEEYESLILDFETLPRPRVSNVLVRQVAKTAEATLFVTWESNTEVSSIVTFYPENNPTLARDNVNVDLRKGEHQILIKGLFPDTNYIIAVRGRDILGNEAVSDSITVKTSTDNRPPQITNLKIEGTNSKADSNSRNVTSQLVVSWTTDEPATSQVEYGEGTGNTYNKSSQEDKNLSFNHVVIISGLDPSKVYHLRAVSKDEAGNLGTSIDHVTITPKATDSAFYLVMVTLQEAFGFLNNL